MNLVQEVFLLKKCQINDDNNKSLLHDLGAKKYDFLSEYVER